MHRDIFQPRTHFKPFEYPEILGYKDAINHSYWLVSEWNFLADIHDFNTRLSPTEKSVIKKTLLAISQIEVSVKKFWTLLGERFPKPEFEQVAATFGESEVRHADAYSHLLEVLGLNADFKALSEVPAILQRCVYLSDFMASWKFTDQAQFMVTLALFSAFIENVSLFSQFAIIKSFAKHKCVLKDIDNVVQATQKEEQIHAMFGAKLVSLVREERPEWFDERFDLAIVTAARNAFQGELAILDWIFEDGELDFLSKATLKEFIKQRLNESMVAMGCLRIYTVDQAALASLKWFTDEMHAEVNTDFFHKRPVTYSKKDKPITAGDLF